MQKENIGRFVAPHGIHEKKEFRLMSLKKQNKFMPRLVVLLAAIGACWSCQTRNLKEEILQAKIDSLEIVVKKNNAISNTLTEVSALIDSIDVSRKMIGSKMDEEEGSHKEIVARMQEITTFVKASQEKIALLDKKLMASGNSYKQYTSAIKNLEASLASRNLELVQLQKRAEHYDNQNQNLIHLVELQRSEIDDKLLQLQTKQEQLARLEEGVNRLVTASADERAESCYQRAQLLEEAANRTKLAPRKKRNTRLEAIELYKMASFYGKNEANEKISELEKKI